MGFEEDVSIDPSALDTEWLEQPSRMMRYCKIAAETKREVDWAKERLDVVRAELDQGIRSDPERFGLGKVTEGAIQNTILLQPSYRQAVDDFVMAKYENDMANAAVKSVDQVKTALENLVRLHGQQYFAGPQVPRDLGKEWEERQRQRLANERVGRRLSRRTRDSE